MQQDFQRSIRIRLVDYVAYRTPASGRRFAAVFPRNRPTWTANERAIG